MKKLSLLCFILFSFSFFAMDFKWTHTYQSESSKELASIVNRMCSPFPATSSETNGFNLVRPCFQLSSSKGTLYFDVDENNIFQAIFYEGNSTLTFSIPDPIEKNRLKRCIGRQGIENLQLKSFCIVPIGNSNDLPQKPADAKNVVIPDNFLKFKTALRKDGLELLNSILNRNLSDPLDLLVLFEMNDDIWAYKYDSGSETEVQLLRLAHPPMQDNFMWDQVAVIHRTKSNVLVPDITPEEYYEKYYYDVKSYEIDYRMDENGKIIDGNVTVKISLKKPHKALLFEYFPHFKILNTKVNGEEAYFIKEDYMEKWGYYENALLVLFKEVKEGDITVTFKTAGWLFNSANGYLYLKDEDLWYPRLEDYDGATYKIKMTVPKENEIISIGELKNHTVNQDSTETFVWEQDLPVRLATFTLGKFIHKFLEAEGLKLDVALPKGVRTNLLTQAQEVTLNELKNDVIVYSKMFGSLPYPVLKVVITHYSHGRGFPTMLLLSESSFFRFGSSWPDQFMAHEVAHQWWGNLVDGLSYRDVWLSEGMAEFSSMLYMGIRFGEDKIKLYHENMILNGNLVKTTSLDSDISVEDFKPSYDFNPLKPNFATSDSVVPFEEGPICLGTRIYSTFTTKPYLGYSYVVYTKSNFVFHMLYTLSKFTKGGQDSFFKGLQTICSKYRGKQITTKMFFAELQNSMGVPLAQFLEDWYKSIGLPKVEVKTEIVSQDGGYAVRATGKCDRNYFFGVPVRVSLDDKRKFDYILLFQNGSATGEWKVPSKPKKVDVDPVRIVFCNYGKVKS